jgi:arylsulfatase A-like enzyme
MNDIRMKNFRMNFLILLSAFLLFSCKTQDQAPSSRPNIILFLVDDFGYADISYEGNTQIKTPNIDRIAGNGAHFTHFYQSGAACAPTRASLLTGRYHLETGVWGVHAGRDFLHRDETTIADLLHDAGYVTGAFGKWHSGKTWSYFSWNRGFDVGIHSNLYQYFDTRVIYNNKVINVEGPITDVIGDQVVRFIDENKERPFFAYVPFQSIHEPYNCPPEVFQKYKEQGYSDHVARLYGMIEVMDRNLGKITDAVDQFGLTENTVIMCLSDDGPSPGFDLSYSNRRMNDEEKVERERGWARNLRGGKGTIWEGGSITPFYIQWKGKIQPGLQREELSGVIDIFPTIMDIAGIPIPENNLPIHGKSFWPVLQGKKVNGWEDRRYFDNTNFYLIQRDEINMKKPQMHHIAMHYQHYKLIRGNNALYGGPDSVYFELYDLENDPQEKTNIIGQDAELANKLIPEIKSWYDGVLSRGRAFKQAIYEIGNWEETSTPINLDAVLDLKGSVKRSEQSAFRFDHWTSPGSGMSFEIDVKEPGAYQAELGYSCDPSRLGSIYQVYTRFDTARVLIDHPSTSLSDTLFLPAGRQVLNIGLFSLGKGTTGVDAMTSLVMHRVPEKKDTEVLRHAGMKIYADKSQAKKIYLSSATADFMFGSKENEALEIEKGVKVKVQAFADNEEEIREVRLYLDFDLVQTQKDSPFHFTLDTFNPGDHTINVEMVSKSGIVRAAHGDIRVN